VFRYKGREIVPRRIGRELGGVEALLVGRARRLADRVLLTVELIDTRDESQLWSHACDCQRSASGESPSVSIVSDVVRAVTGRDCTTVHGRYARNGEVYELYLRVLSWIRSEPHAAESSVGVLLPRRRAGSDGVLQQEPTCPSLSSPAS
jgi:hypothetical protein